VRRIAVLLVAASLTLAACGGSDDDTSSDATSTEAATTIVDGPVPDVSGGEFGSKPTVASSTDEPSSDLAVKVVTEGDGKEVKKNDLLVAHYLGQIWGTETVFDNSYDKGEPAAFAIGAGQVIKGWDEGLVGQKVGSRVELAIPPALGYGESGQESAGIKGDDTLVFVVDILDTYSPGVSSESTPITTLPAGLPTVQDNGAGKAPSVTIPEGAAAPAATAATVVADGSGEPLAVDKTLVAQVVQVNFASKEEEYSSWDEAPLSFKAADLPGLTEALTGKNAGTRVLLQVSAADSGKDPLVLVIDTVDSF